MNHNISIANHAFVPNSLTVKLGDSVSWTNNDTMRHTASRDDAPAFDTGRIDPGTTSNEIVFSDVSPTEGFEYFCRPHPFMRGFVVVERPSQQQKS